MKIVRFLYKGKKEWGVLSGDTVKVLKEVPFDKIITKGELSLGDVSLLAPVVPGKIVLTGLNYSDHAKELDMQIPKEPVLFLKPPSAVLKPDGEIIYPPGVQRLDYEAELAVVIKKRCRAIREESAPEYILGYTCLNDVTARDLQKKDIQWSRAKSFDTFCPIGPFIETDIEADNLRIRSYLNGSVMQDSSTSEFIFSVNYLIAFISKIMTLSPGDVISTGTPPGVGEMKRGDTIEVEIQGLGKLRNKVASS